MDGMTTREFFKRLFTFAKIHRSNLRAEKLTKFETLKSVNSAVLN